MTTVLPADIASCIQRALDEDLRDGDATTNSIVPVGATLRGHIVAKQDGVVAGIAIAETVFRMLSDKVNFRSVVEDGSTVSTKTTLAEVDGSARALLTGERVALNF